MADDVTYQSATPATPPSGTVVATDDVSGVQYQKVKIDVGGDGVSAPLGNANPIPVSDAGGSVTVDGSVTANAGTNLNTSALALESGGNLAAIKTAVEVIDNFISGSRGLVTEDNSAASLTALQIIDNFISGARGLVTEDNSAAIKAAVEVIDNFISGSRGLVTEDNSAAALTALQLLDDAVATIGSATPSKGLAMAGTDGTNARILKTDTGGELQVDVLSSALPSGAATEATLSSVKTAVELIDNTVSGSELQVDIVTAPAIAAGDNAIGRVKLTDGTDVADVLDLTNSNPLTVAIVDGAGSQITSFGGGTQYTEGDTDASITGSAVMWEDTSDTLRPVSAAKPLPVNVVAGGAGDGAILDGVSSSIKATVLDYTNANPVAVRLSDTNGDYVGAGAGTQYTEDAAAAADPVGTALNLVRKDTPASEVSGDGDNIAARGNSAGALYVELLSGTDKLPGSATDGLLVNLGANNDVTGTVTANLAAGTNNIGDVDVLSIAAGDNNIGNVDIVTVPAPLSTTGGGTEAAALRVTLANDSTGVVSVDDNGASLTVDGTVAVSGTVAVTQSGTWDEVGINDSGNSITVDNAALSVVGGGAESTALRVTLANDSTGVVSVDDNGASLTVDGTVTANLAAGTNNIGDVDILSIAAGDNNIGNVDVVSLPASTNTIEVVGDVAHGATAAGNPLRVGLTAETSPKGITLVTDGQATAAYGDADGIQMVKLNTSGADSISEAVSNTDGASTAFSNFGAVASTYNYVTAITVFRSDTGTTLAYVDFRDGTGGSVKWRMPLPPNSGSTVASAQPLFKTSANTALAYDVSSALTTVYISVSGFQSKV